jgi:hypothetical protein
MPNAVDLPIKDINLNNLYFIVQKGTNNRMMCENDTTQPLIFDNKSNAENYEKNIIFTKKNREDITPVVKFTVMSIAEFMDKFEYS